ncbi:CDP-glycerol glycerophosphotransferase family protein, partial [Staphylococcus saprophyticus]|nr:CDP-glycerol glycerophosphotransferase family protein [Staphylococcus saprophyticus]
EVWLLSERTNSASDNSYFLYDYLQNQRKDIRSYYLIEKNAKNHLPKLKQYKNIIFLRSFKHKLFMLIANKYLTSFT